MLTKPCDIYIQDNLTKPCDIFKTISQNHVTFTYKTSQNHVTFTYKTIWQNHVTFMYKTSQNHVTFMYKTISHDTVKLVSSSTAELADTCNMQSKIHITCSESHQFP